MVVSTSPAIRSRANQAAWYSLTICSPGSQRFKRFTVNDSYSLSRSSEIVALVHAHLHQRSRTHGETKTILFMPLSLAATLAALTLITRTARARASYSPV